MTRGLENYILIDREPVTEPDIVKYGEWHERESDGDRRVDETMIGAYRISTVFLGLNHNWSAEGPPILFETMVFGPIPDEEEYQTRCATWREAEAMHHTAIHWVNGRIRRERRRYAWLIIKIAVALAVLAAAIVIQML